VLYYCYGKEYIQRDQSGLKTDPKGFEHEKQEYGGFPKENRSVFSLCLILRNGDETFFDFLRGGDGDENNGN
jgi:hypothetical protein